MKTMLKRFGTACATCCALLPLTMPQAAAESVTFSYDGSVSRQESPFFDAGYAVGTALTFTFSFDPDAVTGTRWEGAEDASALVYEWFDGGWSFEMSVGGDTYSAAHSGGSPFDIRVENDIGPVDRYGVRVRPASGERFEFPNGTSSSLLQLFLTGADQALFADTSLPLTAPDAAGIVGSFFGAHLQATVDGPAPVPLPATVFPMLGALAGLWGADRRRQRKARTRAAEAVRASPSPPVPHHCNSKPA